MIPAATAAFRLSVPGVMGIDRDFGVAFAKAQMSVSSQLPTGGRIFISVGNRDKEAIVPIARTLTEAGFELVATAGTRAHLEENGVEARQVMKISEGRPHVIDLLTDGSIGLMINTPADRDSHIDDYEIRRAAIIHRVPYTTTIPGAIAAVQGIMSLKTKTVTVKSLQDYHA